MMLLRTLHSFRTLHCLGMVCYICITKNNCHDDIPLLKLYEVLQLRRSHNCGA